MWYYLAMRITAKGQVTIPQEIREELGLLPNTEVTFDIVDGEARLRKARSSGRLSRGDGVIEHLRSVRPSNKLTTDEIMALMRGSKSVPKEVQSGSEHPLDAQMGYRIADDR